MAVGEDSNSLAVEAVGEHRIPFTTVVLEKEVVRFLISLLRNYDCKDDDVTVTVQAGDAGERPIPASFKVASVEANDLPGIPHERKSRNYGGELRSPTGEMRRNFLALIGRLVCRF